MNESLTQILPAIRRFAYSLTGSVHDADDLLQNTVERILTRPVPEDADLLKWAFRICRNLWIDEYRASKVRGQATACGALQETPIDGEAIIHNQITLMEVDSAMATLPNDQRAILALVAVQGLAYQEVADVLKIPIGTVMSRLARARAALSRQLHSPQRAKP
ncbi:MAG: RNA polymerase sigma factor [Porticoccaceae bacterium]|nr:RNA polymerase sigma factor [Porticoccaceae bacterium]